MSSTQSGIINGILPRKCEEAKEWQGLQGHAGVGYDKFQVQEKKRKNVP